MRRSLLTVLLSTGLLHGQTAAGGAVGAGYNVPAVIKVAPGQVVTFFVHGIGASLTAPVRAGVGNWPTDLGGISANFIESSTVFPDPLLAVEPIATCGNPGPGCGSYTAVTLQIPFGIFTNPGTPLGVPPFYGAVQFLENGSVQSTVEVYPAVDQIHLLRYCDLIFAQRGGCAPVVAHADGSPVSPAGGLSSPAMPGETVVLYVVGLGNVLPLPRAGVPFAPGAQSTLTPPVSFDFRPNAMASRPPVVGSQNSFVPVTTPVYVGPVPGYVGLYQVNVQIPQPPPALPQCDSKGEAASAVGSNLTINVGGITSFDGAPICVKPLE